MTMDAHTENDHSSLLQPSLPSLNRLPDLSSHYVCSTFKHEDATLAEVRLHILGMNTAQSGTHRVLGPVGPKNQLF